MNMSINKSLRGAALSVASCLLLAPALMPGTALAGPLGEVPGIYVCIDGIEGGSRTQGFEDCIEASSVAFEAGRTIVTPPGGSQDRETGAPTVSDVVITKVADVASSRLFIESVSGRSRAVQIAIVEPGSTLTLGLSNVLIGAFTVSSGDESPTTERVAFDYTRIAIEYTEIDEMGLPGAPVRSCFDVQLGRRCVSPQLR